MALFEKFNRVSTVREGIDLGSMEFKNIRDFAGQTIYVDGFFFTRGKYGEQVVVVGNGYKINMPNKAVEDFKKMMADKPTLEAILNGQLTITSIYVRNTPRGNIVNYTYKDKQ